MKKFVYFFFLSTILLLSSCKPSIPNDEQSKISEELPYNQQVFYQVFPAIFDSLEVVNQLKEIPPPPPPALEYYKDSIEYNNAIYEYREMLKRIELDTMIPIIAIHDSVFYNDEQSKKYGLSKNKKTNSQKSFKIDMEKLFVQADTFQLAYLSEVTMENSFEIKSKFRKRVKVVFSLFSVHIDSTKTNGFLDWGISRGHLCGYGGKIFIQNINGRWVIVKITNEWVS